VINFKPRGLAACLRAPRRKQFDDMGKRVTGSRVLCITIQWMGPLLVILALAAWVAVILHFPFYCRRDDVRMLDWSSRHPATDAFVPTPAAGLAHDGMFRPFVYLWWEAMFGLLGMNSLAHHFVTGALFVLSMAALFKLAGRLIDRRAAYMSVAIWLGAFQSLLTVLFWFTDQLFPFEMMLAMLGFYWLTDGLGRSRTRVALGVGSILLLYPQGEVMMVTATVSVALLFVTYGIRDLKWSRGKAWLCALVAGLLGLGYFAIIARFLIGAIAGKPGTSHAQLLPLVMERLAFMGYHLSSGVCGLLLVVPAAYYALSRLLQPRLGREWGFVASMVLSFAILVGIQKTGLHGAAVLVLLIGGLALPSRFYFLLPLAFLPIAGLTLYSALVRTYLFWPAFPLAIMAAAQWSELCRPLVYWWLHRIRSRALGLAFLALILLGGGTLIARKVSGQIPVLRMRSDITMSLKDTRQLLRRLPRGAQVIVVGYESLGVNFKEDVRNWSDYEKVLYQPPLGVLEVPLWCRVIGRPDLRVVSFADYRARSGKFVPGRPAYVFLMSPKDSEFFDAQRIPTETVGEVVRGRSRMRVLMVK